MATHSSILAWRIPMDRGDWATVHEVAKSQTRLSNRHPGGPVFRTLSFHCRGPGSVLIWETKIPKLRGAAKNKQKSPKQSLDLSDLHDEILRLR